MQRRTFPGIKAVFLCAAVAASAAIAEVPWFDAGIAGMDYWPSDGTDLAVPGAGTWRETSSADLVGEPGARFLALRSVVNELSFDLGFPRNAAEAEVAVAVQTTVSPCDELPIPDQTAKGGMCFVVGAGEPIRAMGLARDPESATNVWVALSGRSFELGELVEVKVSLLASGETPVVAYSVGGTVLSSSQYGEWNEVVLPGEESVVVEVACRGTSHLHGLGGAVAGDPAYAALAVPELDGMTVTSVKTAAGTVEPSADGTYSIPAGAVVTVSLATGVGKFLSSDAVAFEMQPGGMTMPTDSLPRIIEARDILRVNEVMASNDSSLPTAAGKRGLDWIEIRNTADFPVDIAGWYLFDDPKKNPSKWERIQGACVIPAGGYKIVWADKDYEGFLPDEAYTRIGLSSSGERPFLADPTGEIVDECPYGIALEDVSQGRDESVGAIDGVVYFKTPTPGRANTTAAFAAPTPKVEFSVPHGWKTEAFTVELSCPEAPDAEIRYTTDGTSPKADSPLYSGPIAVSRTTVLRAGVPDEGSVLQRDASATYLFLDDVLTQDSSVPSGFPSDREVNNQAMAYGFNSTILQNYNDRIRRGFTNSISTISLVIDPEHLFGSTDGIYTHPGKDGIEWERQLMVEMFSPTGAEAGFSGPAGVRIRGAYSRTTNCPKHSLRLFFRSDYGMQKLEYPLFGDEGADEFKKIDLRTSQNFGWAWLNSEKETFIHEVFPRDSQRDMGQPYTRSRYYNVFINGQYWGMYQTEERVDEHYAETYLGGDKSSYDVVRTSQPGYVTGIVEGNETAWRNLWDIVVNEGFGEDHPENYKRVLGLNPDGTRNTEYPVHVHPESLMVFMLTAHYSADTDSPASADGVNNLCGMRNRCDGSGYIDGWVFCRHDAEHALGVGGATDTTLYGTDGHPNHGANFLRYKSFGPAEINYRLLANAEYRMAFADLVYRECLRPGGAMTAEKAEARFRARMAEIDDAITCESARWGHGTKTRETWLSACDKRIDFITNRVPVLVGQYRARGWYPQVDAPYLRRADGARLLDGDLMAADERAYFASVAEGGTAYYTTDGTDPRAEGGAVGPSATAYDAAQGVALPAAQAKVRVRVLSADGEWSALEEVSLLSETPSDQRQGVRVAAVYSSTADGGGDGSEFIVLTNLLGRAVALEGLRVACAKKGGIASPSLDLVMGPDAELAANGALPLSKSVLWPELEASTGKPLQKITNGDVDMKVWDADGVEIQNLGFSAAWWPVGKNAKGKDVGACDGTGAHFVALEFGGDVTDQVQWRPSFMPPPYDSAGYGAVVAAAEEEGVRRWLDGLAATEEGQRAITNFAGTADALVKCYLVDQAPESEPDIEVEIPSIAFDAEGRPVVGGKLMLHGAESERTVNGMIRLYHAPSLQQLDQSGEYLDLGREFPVPSAPREVPNTPSRFFRLWIGK